MNSIDFIKEIFNVHLIEWYNVIYQNTYQIFFDHKSRFSPFLMVPSLLIAFLYYKRKAISNRTFLKDIFSREQWLSGSAKVDYIIVFMVVLGIWRGDIFNLDVAIYLESFKDFYLNQQSEPILLNTKYTSLLVFVWAFSGVVLLDFLRWLLHFLQHRYDFLWSFHAVHHSAEHLNFFTAYRYHPIDVFLNRALVGIVFFGYSIVGIRWFGLVDFRDYLIVAIVYILYASYGLFRHSHAWITFPKPLSYILMSPAMHVIHHSQHPKHNYRNYAMIFSFWDWAAGSIYIPGQEDKDLIEMGVPEDMGLKPSKILNLTWVPFVLSYRAAHRFFRSQVAKFTSVT